MFEWIIEVKRECGLRSEGGTYLRSAEGSENGIIAAFSVIDPPIPVQRKPHRGPILVKKEQVLSRQPEDTWVVGNSAGTVEKKRATEAWEDLFGMPLYRRLDTGDCAGAKSAEEAYDRLLSCAVWNKQAEQSIRQMSLDGWQDLPNMSGLYSILTNTLFRYAATRDLNHLVKAGATAWQMYYQLPPRKRTDAMPLARLLAALGFVKDGREMLLMSSRK